MVGSVSDHGRTPLGLSPLARVCPRLTWSGTDVVRPAAHDCWAVWICIAGRDTVLQVTERLDLLGAALAYVIYLLSIVVFSSRIVFGVSPGHWIGVPFLLTALPLSYLLVKAGGVDRPLLYYVQVGLMLGSVIMTFLLDYVYKVEWRDTQWMVVAFVTLYFAGLGGMIGVASLAGQGWTVGAVILFFVAAVLAFVQRSVTGL